jgi:CheY-like chemotaxis protein
VKKPVGELSERQEMKKNEDRRLTIMVVDDYDEIRLLMRKVLETSGYRVVEAKDGEEAVETARNERPDLILMDLCLPFRSGVSAVYHIRKQSGLRDVPIVAVTAYASADLHLDAIKAGCVEYLTKPIDLDRLKEVLERHLGDMNDAVVNVTRRSS